jgi:MFS transporter, ACS family, hexuronate transporter
MQTNAIGKYRWTVVTLLFFATTINYLDRQVLGLLKPTLEKEFAWTEKDYSYIVMAFSATYAIGLMLLGRVIDRIGTKLGYTISVIVWSIAAMLHALVKSTLGFGMARALLGIGEAGNFPAAIKTVAEWFPKKERAFATGIFNSGSNIGAVVAPIMVPAILGAYGWQEAFIITGAIGFIWLIFWIYYYEVPARQKKLSEAEFAYIHSDETDSSNTQATSIAWHQLFTIKQTWALIAGKFFTDPIWWFMLFWLPSYFSSTFKIDLTHPGWPLVIIYSATTIGSIGGGYLSSYFIQKGMAIPIARKTAMLLFACCVIPIIFAQFTNNMWVVVAIISLAVAAHQAWSANIYTVASDYFPKQMVSSVIGIAGMSGAVGGIIFPLIIGIVLDHFKMQGNITTGYNLLFVVCGCAYLLAWCIMHWLTKNAVVDKK